MKYQIRELYQFPKCSVEIEAKDRCEAARKWAEKRDEDYEKRGIRSSVKNDLVQLHLVVSDSDHSERVVVWSDDGQTYIAEER